MRTIKRVKPEREAPAFWIEKRGNRYIAYQTFINAVMGIASPSLMSHWEWYSHSLKQIYEGKKF